MKTLRLLLPILLVGAVLVWQVTARAGNAVVLKSGRYAVPVPGAYTAPGRALPKGEIVKVVAIHGKRADVMTCTGDLVSIPLKLLHLLPDAPSPTPDTFPSPAAATSPSPDRSPLPPNQAPAPAALRSSAAKPLPAQLSPSPTPAGGTRDKAADTANASPSQTARRSEAVRCSHILKSGEQCSRMTTSPNGLCWQHGGD